MKTGIYKIVNKLNSKSYVGSSSNLNKRWYSHIFRLKKIHTGKKMSEEARKKMSESRKGRKLSEETKEKLRKTSKGRKHTEEARKKMSESRKGAVVTEKVKKTLSNLYKGKSWKIVEGKRVWVI
jgi:DNA integrity scanning protein DisA with diadenylate cyclase activity